MPILAYYVFVVVKVLNGPSKVCSSSVSTITTSDVLGYIAYSTAIRWGVPSQHCPVRIQARAGQKIELRLVDFDHHQRTAAKGALDLASETSCSAYVVIKDGHQDKSLPLCDKKERTSVLYISASDVIVLYFALTRQTQRNFLLHYQGKLSAKVIKLNRG